MTSLNRFAVITYNISQRSLFRKKNRLDKAIDLMVKCA